MARYITLTNRIQELIIEHGGLRAAGRALDVNPSYLKRLKDGERFNPSDSLLRRMDLISEVKYKRIGD